MCIHTSRSVVAETMHIDRKSAGGICKRVYDRFDASAKNRFDGLVRIGVDETSYKKGHKYMTVVVDHDTGRVIWCAKGYGKAVLESFFSLPTDKQRTSMEKPPSAASTVRTSRYAPLKNPENLTASQKACLERIARENKVLYRAYLLKERLRDVFKNR